MAEGFPSFIETAAAKLAEYWRNLPKKMSIGTIPAEIATAIKQSVNSATKTYRYVLPTQLLAKVTDLELDCRSVQMQSGLNKPFDARSLCHGVIVPFDQANNCVLGGSTEPYINNPIRIPAITDKTISAQRDKTGFQYLVDVLAYAQAHPKLVSDLFRLTLAEVKDRLGSVRVTYPAPKRLSLKQALVLVEDFFADRTGGLRMQAVAVALFRAIGEQFNIFESVRSSKINAADASTGNAADLECLDHQKRVIVAVEVKDRALRLYDLQAKLPAIREHGIAEVLFLVQGGVGSTEKREVAETIDRQFPSGHNVYVTEFDTFLESCLVLFGESGRREFIRLVSLTLEEQKADIVHRRKWAELLSVI